MKRIFPNKLESWFDLLHEEDKARVAKRILGYSKRLYGRETYDVEYRLLTKHAGWRWFHAAGRLSRREDGSPITFVGLFVDIDDEKKMEEQLEKHKLDLEDDLQQHNMPIEQKRPFLIICPMILERL